MPKPIHAIPSAVLVATLALAMAGCGSSSTGSGRKTINIPFQSLAIKGTAIPAKYTCDGRDTWPKLEWAEVPAGTNELALFLLGLTPSANGGSSISINWAVAGIDPTLHHVESGKLPHGAIRGTNSDGKRRYHLCPTKGKSETFEFALYAVRPSVKVPSKFRGIQLLGEVASSNSPTVSAAAGAITVAYKRK